MSEYRQYEMERRHDAHFYLACLAGYGAGPSTRRTGADLLHGVAFLRAAERVPTCPIVPGPPPLWPHLVHRCQAAP